MTQPSPMHHQSPARARGPDFEPPTDWHCRPTRTPSLPPALPPHHHHRHRLITCTPTTTSPIHTMAVEGDHVTVASHQWVEELAAASEELVASLAAAAAGGGTGAKAGAGAGTSGTSGGFVGTHGGGRGGRDRTSRRQAERNTGRIPPGLLVAPAEVVEELAESDAPHGRGRAIRHIPPQDCFLPLLVPRKRKSRRDLRASRHAQRLVAIHEKRMVELERDLEVAEMRRKLKAAHRAPPLDRYHRYKAAALELEPLADFLSEDKYATLRKRYIIMAARTQSTHDGALMHNITRRITLGRTKRAPRSANATARVPRPPPATAPVAFRPAPPPGPHPHPSASQPSWRARRLRARTGA